MRSFLLSMLSQAGGVSSKRVWASIILCVLCFSYVWCTVNHVDMVSHTDAFLTLAGVLLGIEAAVSPFQKAISEGASQARRTVKAKKK